MGEAACGGAGGAVITKFNGGVEAGFTMTIDASGYVHSYRNVEPWEAVSSVPVQFGAYNHVCATYAGNMLYIYINGKNAGGVYFPWTNPYSTNTPVLIGAALGSGTPNGFFDGEIDEVRVWNYAKDEGQINQGMYTAVAGTETGLLATWHFDEAEGAVAYDATNNNFGGALMNGPTYVWPGSMRQAAPSNLIAKGENTQIKLSWSPGIGEGNIQYNIYGGMEPNPTVLVGVNSGGIHDTTKTITGLTNFTNYFYRVTIVDDTSGESGYTNEVKATPSTFVEVSGLPFVQAYNGPFLWGDYDNDGDYDVFISGSIDSFYASSPNELGVARLYRNNSGIFTEVDAGFQQDIHRTSASWCDYNNDGYLDLAYMGSSGNGTRSFKLYKNNGNGTFTDVSINISGQAFGSMAWGDYDNDGDQDVIVGGNDGSMDNTLLYRNDGNDLFTYIETSLSPVTGGSVAWGDYDNDRDLDLLILGNGSVNVFRNDNYDTFTPLSGEGPLFQGVNRGQAIWADYNNDGLLDVVYSGASGEGRFAAIYRNDGGDWFTNIDAGLTAVARSTVASGDFDNDGDLDFFFSGDPDMGYTNSASYLCRNDGDDLFTQLDIGIPGVQGAKMNGNWPHLPSSAFVDFDRDGDLDIMVEGMDPSLKPVTRLYENQGTVFNLPPSDPTGLGAILDANTAVLVWNKSTDTETPQNALTYNLRVGTTPAGIEIMSPMAKVVGSGNAGGFRLVQQMGNVGHNNVWQIKDLSDGTYYWSVEAIDQVYRNSKFQSELFFTIDGPPTVPSNIRVSAGVNSVTLTWDRSQKSSVDRYVIIGGLEPGMTDSIDAATGGIADTSKIVTGLENEVIYYFRVYAIDPTGNVSGLSEEVSVRPSATPGRIFVNGEFGLASAINEANSLSQSDTITFEFEPGSTIDVYSELPAITGEYTIIDGDVDSDGTPDIRVVGNHPYNVFTILSSNNVIKGLVIGSYYSTGGGNAAILITGSEAHHNRILGNFIGTDMSGSENGSDGRGILIDNGAHHNWIGDGTTAGLNVISGNSYYGIKLQATGSSTDNNKILGNIIGLSVDGFSSLPNSGSGIHLTGRASYNQIGNATAGGRNIISGNFAYGIYLEDVSNGHLEGNQVLGNYIGTDISGLGSLANQNGGIYLEGYGGGGGEVTETILNTQIGNGTVEGINVISGNGSPSGVGIQLVGYTVHNNIIDRNYIGVAADGVTALGNSGNGVYLTNTYRNTIANNFIANNSEGIYLDYASENTISGNTISGNQGSGIRFYYSNGNTITGNRIGTDQAGLTGMANLGYGMTLEYYSDNNMIGNGTPAGRNIISGNGYAGIRIGTIWDPVNGNKVYGNYIGTNATGTIAMPNSGSGVILENWATYNEIGGLEPGQGNIISGNLVNGVFLSYSTGGGTDWNKIQQNIIGLSADGSTVLENEGNGIYLEGQVTNTEIKNNIVSGNAGAGIFIFDNGFDASGTTIVGNYIGTDNEGLEGRGNLGAGIHISSGGGYSANYIVIGDGTDAGKNIVSGNLGCGIEINGNSAHQNKIIRNYIGINLDGTALPNDLDGIRLDVMTYEDTIMDNVISGNTLNGIAIDGSWNHLILGNLIGTDPSGTVAVGNGQSGIYFHDAVNTYGTRIGDGTDKGKNVISGNGYHGIMMYEDFANGINDNVVVGNLIGKASDGITSLGNTGSGVFMQSVGGAFSITNNLFFKNTVAHNTEDGFTMVGGSVHYNSMSANSIFANDGSGIVTIDGAQNNDTPVTIDSLGVDNILYGSGAGYQDIIQVYINGSDDEGQVYFDSTLADEAGNWSLPLTRVIGNLNITALRTSMSDGANTTAFSVPLLTAPGTFIPDSLYLNFGDVAVGDSLALTIEAAVSGNGIITTSGELDFETMFRGINGTQFPDTSFDGEKITGTFKFKPSTFGSLSDTLRLTNNSTASSLIIYMQGNGVPGDLMASSSTIDFGNILVGDSALQMIRLYTNNGPVVLDSAKLDLGNQFLVSGLELPDTLFAGDTVDVDIKFKPTIFGAIEDTVRIFNNSLVTPFNIVLAGYGQAGTLVTTTPILNFGNVLVGDSAKLKLKLYGSTGLVQLNDPTLDLGGQFRVEVVGLPSTLGVGDSIVADVIFKPTVFGQLSDTVRFTNNSIVNPFNITLDGAGIAGSLAVMPSSLNFGSVLLGDSAVLSFKVYASTGHVLANSGTLTFGNHFKLNSALGLPDSLIKGDTITVGIKFKPLTFGLFSDTLLITNNSTVSQLKVVFSGTGGSGTLAASAVSMILVPSSLETA